MSKNTGSNAFRKIDVDQFNEDNFKDEDVGSGEEMQSLSNVSTSEISNLLSTNKHLEALKLLLQTSPATISTTNPGKVTLIIKSKDYVNIY